MRPPRLRRIREDVHIHASREQVYERLAAPDGAAPGWLPAAFRDVRHGDGMLVFALALGGRRERWRLAVREQEPPALLVLGAVDDGAAGGADGGGADGGGPALAWGLHAESPRSAHVTLEAAYHPAGGVASLLEPLLYEPLRRQALRDALWRLKRLTEAGGP